MISGSRSMIGRGRNPHRGKRSHGRVSQEIQNLRSTSSSYLNMIPRRISLLTTRPFRAILTILCHLAGWHPSAFIHRLDQVRFWHRDLVRKLALNLSSCYQLNRFSASFLTQFQHLFSIRRQRPEKILSFLDPFGPPEPFPVFQKRLLSRIRARTSRTPLEPHSRTPRSHL